MEKSPQHCIRSAQHGHCRDRRFFLTLAEELHFGRTAERLRMPQPRVSRLIASMERRAGGALFERTSRRVRLTPLGAQLRCELELVYAARPRPKPTRSAKASSSWPAWKR